MFSSVLPWYLNLLFLGWIAWPLTFRVCTRLHDRGYALSRALGLILTAYLTWLIGNRGTQPLLPFGYTSVLLSAGVIALVSLVSFLSERKELFAFVRRQKRTILFYEGLFLLAFAALVTLRAHVPHISYFSTDYTFDPLQDFAAEKFTDFSILNGLLASAHFPPNDPWLAGATMNYYYFGHLLWAVLIKLTGVRPEIGYNLAMASAFALVALQAASIGYNLTRRLRWGLLASFLCAAAGNLDGFLQIFSILKGKLIDAGSDGLPLVLGWQSWFRNYDFWRSSRAVENTITEFPAFSFVLGDLHAHVSGLVILLAGFGLLIQIARSIRRYPSLLRYEMNCWEELFLAALLAGAMSAANSWDALTFAAVAACTLWGARLRYRPETARDQASETEPVGQRLFAGAEVALLVTIVVLIGAKGLFFSYGRFFQPPFPPLLLSVEGGGIRLERLPQGLNLEETRLLSERTDALLRSGRGGAEETAFLHNARWKVDAGVSFLRPGVEVVSGPLRAVRPTSRTSVVEFVAHWALLMFAPLLLTASLARRAWRRQSLAGPVPEPRAAPLPFEESSPLPPYPGPANSLSAARFHGAAGSNGRQRLWALAALGLAVAFVLFPVLQGWVACLGTVAFLGLVAALTGFWQPPAIRTFLALLLAWTALALFCEFFYLDDIFDTPIERINTVFKVYYGMWQIAALATVVAVHRLIRYTPPFRRRRRSLLLLLPLLVVGGMYTVMAPVQRALSTTRLGKPDAAYESLPPESLPAHMAPEARPQNLEEALDGLRYLRFIHPDDYAAIRWMRDRRNVPADARILEAAATQYDYAGRFSTITGRPALAGWLMHEYGWRGPRFIPERERRTTTTQEIYRTKNPFRALTLLAADNIEYVVLGELERRKYPVLQPGSMPELKFRAIGNPVFESGTTTIYKINLPDEQGMNVQLPPGAVVEDEEDEEETTPTESEETSPTAASEAPFGLDSSLTTDSLLEALTRHERATTAPETRSLTTGSTVIIE